MKWWERNKVDATGAKLIVAKYDRLKDWRMDPKGYFLIRVNHKEKSLEVGYCKKVNTIDIIIQGKTAMDVFNTIIREGLVSSLQHAADLGAELQKAEIALHLDIEYVQDSPLNFKRKISK